MMRLVISTVILLTVNLSAQLIPSSMPNVNLESRGILSIFSSFPLSFTENRGQWNDEALFKAEAGGATFWFCQDEVAYVFARDTDELIDKGISRGPDIPGMPDKFNRPRYKKESLVIRAQFVGANPDAEIVGENRLSHDNNYFLGNDPSKWATDVSNYSSITYKDLYPGIDLKYHGNGQGMKYDFIVNPGANISQIRIRYDGVEDVTISNRGDLEATTSFGPIHENIPSVYQETGGGKKEVTGSYIILEPGVFGFEVEGYNPSLPLVIDPELIYSTYLGGNDYDGGGDIVVDGGGSAYIAGTTYSTDFPFLNPYQTDRASYDVFVTKIAPAGNSLVYSTYLGGNADDHGRGIVVDASGNAYVTGNTYSTDFPTQNPYQTDQPYGDAFVTKLSPEGNSLIYSTFLGGNDNDFGCGITVEVSGNAYVTGYTFSTNFPTQNPYQIYQGPTYHLDVFATKLSPSGNSLVYGTYLGGNNDDWGEGIAVDVSGNAYVTGYTFSTNFPTQNPYQIYQGSAGNADAFVTKLSSSGNTLVYSTYLGGNDNDFGIDIAVDGDGNAYVAGQTYSTDFPTQNPYQTDQPSWDAFVTKIAPAGSPLVYSTYLGGGDQDCGSGIAVDGSGSAYVTGWTQSTDFPTLNPYQTYQAGYDAFVTKIAPTGNSLVYSTNLGGSAHDCSYGIAVDGSGNAYVTGDTYSSDFPTVNPYDGSNNGDWDVFVIKLGNFPNPPTIPIIFAPIDGAGVDSITVISWYISSDPDSFDAVSYTIQIDNDSIFTSPEINQSGLLSGALADDAFAIRLGELEGFENLQVDTRYFWRVRADDNYGLHSDWTDGSNWFVFMAQNHAPSAPDSGFTPSDGEEIISLTPTIAWFAAFDPDSDDHPGTLSYSIELDTDTTFTGFVYRDTTGQGENLITISDLLLDNTHYFYRLKTIDDGGLFSTWSLRQNFWTNHYNFPPEPFPLFAPYNGQKQVVYYTHFSWGNTVDYDPMSNFTFTLQYSIDSLFLNYVRSIPGLNDTAISLLTDSLAITGPNLFWRVVAVDDDSLSRIGGLPEGPRSLLIIPPGDANTNGVTNGIDATFMVAYLKGQGAAPDPIQAGDANGNRTTNGIDVVYLVAYLKGIGAPPVRPDCDVVIAGRPKPLEGGR